MKTVIFAGGLGSRISEETYLKPKPMIEIGGKPILWHIMKIYRNYGFREFVICLGYKGYVIKEYFANYFLHNSDVTIDLASSQIKIHKSDAEDISVTLVETGNATMTAGRLSKVKAYVGADENFMLTYGDGVCDIDINELVTFHKSHGKIATITSVLPPGRFGVIDAHDNGLVKRFEEKPSGKGWINGGFFVLNKRVFDYLEGDMSGIPWEKEPLDRLSADEELVAFRHQGFWKCMDTLRDKNELERLWLDHAPWKVWT